jgi:hypothetical protein
MLATYKKGRDNSGHSGHPNKYRVSSVPSRMSRVLRTRDRKWQQPGPEDSIVLYRVPGDFALDCAVATTRPMSRTGRTVA